MVQQHSLSVIKILYNTLHTDVIQSSSVKEFYITINNNYKISMRSDYIIERHALIPEASSTCTWVSRYRATSRNCSNNSILKLFHFFISKRTLQVYNLKIWYHNWKHQIIKYLLTRNEQKTSSRKMSTAPSLLVLKLAKQTQTSSS